MQTALIEVQNANLTLGGQAILKDICIDFSQGLIHGVIGRNGSGKTVLFRAICGLQPLTSGAIFVRGKQIGKDEDFASNIGMIIESPGFIPSLSGLDNLLLLARIRNRISKDRCRDTMRAMGLDPESKKKVGKYSLGMQQRLGLAQAVMEEPDLLILDEPMNGLDKQGVAFMRDKLLELKNSGKTILIASHHDADIDRLCDRIIEMEGGRIERIDEYAI